MNILAPADHSEEVTELIAAGADELYGGFVSPDWQAKYALDALNKRGFAEAQFRSENDLRKAVEIAHSKGVPLFLTLNTHFFSEEQHQLVLKEVERAMRIGIDALILADLGLILQIKEAGYPIRLKMSTAGTVLNPAAAKFYQKLGVGTIIFDRSLSVGEITEVVRNTEGLTFEVFIIMGHCPNVQGFCTLPHYGESKGGIMPCDGGYSIACSNNSENRLSEQTVANLKHWEELKRPRGCGLCAIYDFNKLGVKSYKIVGRGIPTPPKLKAVRTLAKIKSILEENKGITREKFIKEARKAHEEMHGAPCEAKCYSYCYHPYLATEGKNGKSNIPI